MLRTPTQASSYYGVALFHSKGGGWKNILCLSHCPYVECTHWQVECNGHGSASTGGCVCTDGYNGINCEVRIISTLTSSVSVDHSKTSRKSLEWRTRKPFVCQQVLTDPIHFVRLSNALLAIR